MQLYLSIDDTDNLASPGSGQLAASLAGHLQEQGLTSHCSNISRHQLLVDSAIPYTSHNSAMCFIAEAADTRLADIIACAGQFLRHTSAPGADPGLGVAVADTRLDRQALIGFGEKAKATVLCKEDAFLLAEKTGVHLSEHGGTGGGIIGALAGIGLRLQGSDGRFRGWFDLGEAGRIVTAQSLCAHAFVDAVVDENGQVLADDCQVMLTDTRIKTILYHHSQVIPVRAGASESPVPWTTLTKAEVKRF